MRIHAFCVVCLAFVAAGAWLSSQEEPQTLVYNSDPVDAVLKKRSRFLENLNETLQEWQAGRLTLSDSVSRIIDYCEVHYPSYLCGVAMHEEGDTLSAKVARNLVRHYENSPPAQNWPEYLRRIRKEFAQIHAVGDSPILVETRPILVETR